MLTPDLRWPSSPYNLTPDVLLRVTADCDLSPSCALVLAALAAHDYAVGGGRKGIVWPSVATLARLARCSERSVRRHLQTLTAAGLVEPVEQGGGRGRTARRRLCWERLVPDGPGPREVDPTGRETLTRRRREAAETRTRPARPTEDRKPRRDETRPRGAALAGAAPAGGRQAEAPATPRPPRRAAADLTPEQRAEVAVRVGGERDPVARCRRMAEALAAVCAEAAG